jgi:hypothetical protein
MSTVLTGLIDNFFFMVIPPIPTAKQPDGACLAINDKARVAAGVVIIVPNNLRIALCLAVVCRTFEDEIDIAGIAQSCSYDLHKPQSLCHSLLHILPGFDTNDNLSVHL